jgi:hypothetical protein
MRISIRSGSIVSALSLTALLLCSAVSMAQGMPEAGGPVAGVPITLTKLGGAQVGDTRGAARAATGDGTIRPNDPVFSPLRTTTDASGAFTLPVVPEGSYSLTVGPLPTGAARAKHEISKNSISNMKRTAEPKASLPATGGATVGAITIVGARGGTRTVGGEGTIVVESDGVHPISGKIAQKP